MKSGNNAARYLYDAVRRVERMNAERKALQEDISEVYKDLKSEGFDPTIVRKVVKLREADKQELAKQQELIDTYSHAVEQGQSMSDAVVIRRKKVSQED